MNLPDGDEVVGVLGAHYARAVHWMRVRGRRERRPLDRSSLVVSVIPQHDLAAVGSAQDKVRVESSEDRSHHGGLAVEYVLGSSLFEPGVPNQTDACGFYLKLLKI